MTIDIKTLSEMDLQTKIENIKAEREKTAEALKRYEDELEARKRAVPLGVPMDVRPKYGTQYVFIDAEGRLGEDKDWRCDFDTKRFEFLNLFPTNESAEKHRDMLLTYRKELVNAAKGKPIDIEVLKPFLRKGWVAMDKDGRWFWYSKVPLVNDVDGGWTLLKRCENDVLVSLEAFNFQPSINWAASLQECGL